MTGEESNQTKQIPYGVAEIVARYMQSLFFNLV